MDKGLVTIFGGAGFLGRHVARSFVEAGFRVRVAVRRPHLAGSVRLAGAPGNVDIVQANVRDQASVDAALEGATVAVNLVGILVEKGPQSFEATQSEGAINVATACVKASIDRFVHVSAIGADADSDSAYARSKGIAEQRIRDILPSAVILRPSIVFGPEDEFFNRFAAMASHPISSVLPFLPAIGGGKTKLQPVYAADVAEAVIAGATNEKLSGKTYELGGPRKYSMNELYAFICETIDRDRFALPVPFIAAKPLGLMFGAIWSLPFLPMWRLGGPPLTGDQVELLKSDNVVADNVLSFADLGITELESIEAIVPSYLYRFRPYGQYHQKSDKLGSV